MRNFARIEAACDGSFLISMNGQSIVTFCAILVFGTSIANADWQVISAKETSPLPAGAVFVESEFEKDGASVRLQGVRVDDRKVSFVVVDNPVNGSGRLDSAMQEGGFFAGVNGGYFHENFTPVGLEIADGKQVHPFEKAKLLSGVFAVAGGRPKLIRSADFEGQSKVTQALQAGPYLISNGEVAAGLNDTRRARRTIIATDAKSGWVILLLSPVTLAGAAEILNTPGAVPGLRMVRALNLDGGSSSALWAATQPKEFYFREYGTVRNYLGIREK